MAAAPSAPAPAAQAAKWIPLQAIGVTLEAPADAQASETTPGNYMIIAHDCVTLLGRPERDLADSFADALEEAEASPMGDKLKAWTRKEQKPDGGWALEWSYTSEMMKKDMIGVDYRAVIEGVLYDCGRNVDTAEQAACVHKVCSSLKKI